MTSTPKMPAYAIYQSQLSKKTTDNSDVNGIRGSPSKLSKKRTDNFDANGIRGSPSKNRKRKQKSRMGSVKKTTFVERESDGDEEVRARPRKKRGRPRAKPVDVEKYETENGEHSESSQEPSGEHSEVEEKPGADEIADSGEVQVFESKTYSCGTQAAEQAFEWLINPITPKRFFEKMFEEGPYYHHRNNKAGYYGGLFSSQTFNKIIKENRLEYNKEIDIVAYIEKQRKPRDNGSIVYPDFVWDSYNEGYSVRMRNPQVYHHPLWKLCSLLEEYFSSCVGANMYLTPACSQGFPPHWDDIDAFILQVEGKKLWKVYAPRTKSEEFPQLSSPDLDESTLGKPILEQEVCPGDLLYIPRGYIHQAEATNEYSLHITISTNQQNTWSDFLHHGIEAALEKATEENVELRKSLPKDYFDFAGASTPQDDPSLDTIERLNFREKALKLAKEVLNHFTVDAAADVHAAHFLHGCMRPCFSGEEGIHSIHGNGNRFQNGVVSKVTSLTPSTKVRWIRKRAFRLVIDDEGPKLFHTLSNSLNSKEYDTAFLDVDETAVPAITALFKKHPEYIMVKDLPVEGNYADKRQFAEVLYYNGFLMTEQPLPLEE